jgi:hypothetical protein
MFEDIRLQTERRSAPPPDRSKAVRVYFEDTLVLELVEIQNRHRTIDRRQNAKVCQWHGRPTVYVADLVPPPEPGMEYRVVDASASDVGGALVYTGCDLQYWCDQTTPNTGPNQRLINMAFTYWRCETLERWQRQQDPPPVTIPRR